MALVLNVAVPLLVYMGGTLLLVFALDAEINDEDARGRNRRR